MPWVAQGLSYELPNGRCLFEHLKISLGDGVRVGLVGPNGVGKSTLARMLVGELPNGGRPVPNSDLWAYLPQQLPPPPLTVERYLAGAGGHPWLEGLCVHARCDHLSGGQWARVCLAKVLSAPRPYLLLDEPSNHLDDRGRDQLVAHLHRSPQGVLILSHDRALLEAVDEIWELTPRELKRFPGPWSAYAREHGRAQEREQRALALAQRESRRLEEQGRALQERRRRRESHGKSRALRQGKSRLEISGAKRKAQGTTAKLTQETAARAEAARHRASELWQLSTAPSSLYAHIPGAALSPGAFVMGATQGNFRRADGSRLWAHPVSFTVRGPARVSVEGVNGSGKSTLLRHLVGRSIGPLTAEGRWERLPHSTVWLDQRLEGLREDTTVLEHFRSHCGRTEGEARNVLATFLFQGPAVHLSVATLSGGERLRLALCTALGAHRCPAVLVLDEPTNHVDLPNRLFLERALVQFPGAVVFATHDNALREALGPTHRIALDPRPPKLSKCPPRR